VALYEDNHLTGVLRRHQSLGALIYHQA